MIAHSCPSTKRLSLPYTSLFKRRIFDEAIGQGLGSDRDEKPKGVKSTLYKEACREGISRYPLLAGLSQASLMEPHGQSPWYLHEIPSYASRH